MRRKAVSPTARTFHPRVLDGKVVVVTGASGGIGRACVEAFGTAGARVVMADVDESGRALARRLGPHRCRFIRTDIRDDRSVRALMAETVNTFGSLDVLVNNAAAITPCVTLPETSLEDFDRLVGVNFKGMFLCCKHAHRHLKKARGSVVNISSMAGAMGEKAHAVYSGTKGAMNALTRSMAVDHGRDGIRVNALCPSSVLTPVTDRLIRGSANPAAIVKLRKTINHLGYTAEPEEIAAAAVFLTTPAASFITGAVIPVSGGTECGYGIKY